MFKFIKKIFEENYAGNLLTGPSDKIKKSLQMQGWSFEEVILPSPVFGMFKADSIIMIIKSPEGISPVNDKKTFEKYIKLCDEEVLKIKDAEKLKLNG